MELNSIIPSFCYSYMGLEAGSVGIQMRDMFDALLVSVQPADLSPHKSLAVHLRRESACL